MSSTSSSARADWRPRCCRSGLDAWDSVAGKVVARYTQEKFIRNQTLFVKLQSPALRADLSMMQSELVKKLNAAVGSMVITGVRFY